MGASNFLLLFVGFPWEFRKLLLSKELSVLALDFQCSADASFDLATQRQRQPHETTNCPRKPRITNLHSYNGRVRLREDYGSDDTPLAACGSRLSTPPRSSTLTISSWVMRENRVPYWQREHQKHDGLRTWEKVRYQYIREGKRGAHYMWMKREHQRLVDMDSVLESWRFGAVYADRKIYRPAESG